MPMTVPPIKCQGIKTKLTPIIMASIQEEIIGRWVEPFCGSAVVALNVKPQRALLADTNVHIIRLYRDIQARVVTAPDVREYLETAGATLLHSGEEYFYEVRSRFNNSPNSFDFLFLNRSCFNGVMRFNRKGHFNVPFCRKPQRFAPAYISKIVNQVKSFAAILHEREWNFVVSDFKETLGQVTNTDWVYADPPYTGRHVDYFNTWTESDEITLISLLKQLPCRFLLSTWQGNKFRDNPAIAEHWQELGIHIHTMEHFYHVGATEELRHSMREALISNFAWQPEVAETATFGAQTAMF